MAHEEEDPRWRCTTTRILFPDAQVKGWQGRHSPRESIASAVSSRSRDWHWRSSSRLRVGPEGHDLCPPNTPQKTSNHRHMRTGIEAREAGSGNRLRMYTEFSFSRILLCGRSNSPAQLDAIFTHSQARPSRPRCYCINHIPYGMSYPTTPLPLPQGLAAGTDAQRAVCTSPYFTRPNDIQRASPVGPIPACHAPIHI